MQTDKSFLGTGWNFPPTFRREWYGVEMVSEEEDVKSSIRIILSTIPGQRIMLPNFGCNLQKKTIRSTYSFQYSVDGKNSTGSTRLPRTSNHCGRYHYNDYGRHN